MRLCACGVEGAQQYNVHSFEAYLSTMFLFRGRNYAPLTQAFIGGATAA